MAEKQKRKPKPTKKMTQADQSERFKETARRIGMSENREDFERAFRKIVSHKFLQLRQRKSLLVAAVRKFPHKSTNGPTNFFSLFRCIFLLHMHSSVSPNIANCIKRCMQFGE